jgi:hypothetical protein
VGNAGGTAYAPVSMSGDATMASTGAVTLAAPQKIRQMGFAFDGGGAVLSGTMTRCSMFPGGGTITGWYIEGDQSGSATFGVRSTAFGSYTGIAGYAGYADVTGGGTAPSITAAAQASSTALTGWVTTWTGGDIMCVQMTSPVAFTWVNLHLTMIAN